MYNKSITIKKEVIRVNALLKLRKKAGLSQRYVADYLNISQGAVSQWEQGLSMPSADKLPLLAKLLNCTIDELLENVGT